MESVFSACNEILPAAENNNAAVNIFLHVSVIFDISFELGCKDNKWYKREFSNEPLFVLL